eukprot:Gb_07300 [translate_table: standard]
MEASSSARVWREVPLLLPNGGLSLLSTLLGFDSFVVLYDECSYVFLCSWHQGGSAVVLWGGAFMSSLYLFCSWFGLGLDGLCAPPLVSSGVILVALQKWECGSDVSPVSWIPIWVLQPLALVVLEERWKFLLVRPESRTLLRRCSLFL